MKAILSYIIVFTLLISTSAVYAQKVEKPKKKKVEVRGNCEMCESTIEKTALQIKGVESAEWNQEQELLTVVYHPQTTSLQEVEQKIAKAGYDTKHYIAPMEVYHNLPDCCQYDHKKEEK